MSINTSNPPLKQNLTTQQSREPQPSNENKTKPKMKYFAILLVIVAIFTCMVAAGKDPDQPINKL
jgi:hypothetical protein